MWTLIANVNTNCVDKCNWLTYSGQWSLHIFSDSFIADTKLVQTGSIIVFYAVSLCSPRRLTGSLSFLSCSFRAHFLIRSKLISSLSLSFWSPQSISRAPSVTLSTSDFTRALFFLFSSRPFFLCFRPVYLHAISSWRIVRATSSESTHSALLSSFLSNPICYCKCVRRSRPSNLSASQQQVSNGSSQLHNAWIALHEFMNSWIACKRDWFKEWFRSAFRSDLNSVAVVRGEQFARITRRGKRVAAVRCEWDESEWRERERERKGTKTPGSTVE